MPGNTQVIGWRPSNSSTWVSKVAVSGESSNKAACETTRWSLRFIRKAVRSQSVSFPAQVPVFPHLHRADIQWRIVLLYFVHGWPSRKIASRYGMTRARVAQLLRQWTLRAILRGYVDRIPGESDCFAQAIAR